MLGDGIRLAEIVASPPESDKTDRLSRARDRPIRTPSPNIALLQGAGVVGDAQAFGQKNVQPIADALAPMAHTGALVRQRVLEELLAGEVLEIRVVHPAVSHLRVFEGIVVHVRQQDLVNYGADTSTYPLSL